MLKVGLTGSIAVGKTFVCAEFERLGCKVLDADQTAREVVAVGTPALAEIAEVFGQAVIAPDGSLDRTAMAEIVFGDADLRSRLNSIVHPRVIEAQNEWISRVEAADPDGIAIVDAALMIESGGYRRLEHLIVVWCRPEIQLSRLMMRDALDEAGARRRIDAQMPQEEKKKYGDFLIDTSEGFDETRRQVKDVLEALSELRNEKR